MIVATGLLSWPRLERISDRYGSVQIIDGDGKSVLDVEGLVGKRGTLVVRILETRQSRHIGDLFRGIGPSMPEVGEEIVLGNGTVFFDDCGYYNSVGLAPDDGRDCDWLDPKMLYRCHEQTVELQFVEEVAH